MVNKSKEALNIIEDIMEEQIINIENADLNPRAMASSFQMADAKPSHKLNTSDRVINDFNPPTVVGVVGIGHMPGIVKKWGTVTQDQVRAVVKVEPPSLLARAAVFTVKSLVWGGCLYGAYKVFRGPVSRMLIVR